MRQILILDPSNLSSIYKIKACLQHVVRISKTRLWPLAPTLFHTLHLTLHECS